jgi:hypothetical protein
MIQERARQTSQRLLGFLPWKHSFKNWIAEKTMALTNRLLKKLAQMLP